MKRKYCPSPTLNPRLCLGLESLFYFRETAKRFTLEEFYLRSSGDGMPTGNLGKSFLFP
jgi:hypothetical protein